MKKHEKNFKSRARNLRTLTREFRVLMSIALALATTALATESTALLTNLGPFTAQIGRDIVFLPGMQMAVFQNGALIDPRDLSPGEPYCALFPKEVLGHARTLLASREIQVINTSNPSHLTIHPNDQVLSHIQCSSNGLAAFDRAFGSYLERRPSALLRSDDSPGDPIYGEPMRLPTPDRSGQAIGL